MNKNILLRSHLQALIDVAEVPKSKIIFLHAKVRNLKEKFGIDYTRITEVILDTLYEKLSAECILVPTYTNASFRYTGIYHRVFSRSEVGRFSEEVRKNFSMFRTPDPVYSVADTSNTVKSLSKINYQITYGENSLFDRLNQNNYLILNIGLEDIYSTQLHRAELNAEVPYRFLRTLSGIVYHDEDSWEIIDYKTYILNSSRIGVTSPAWDRDAIEEMLINKQIVKKSEISNTRLLWARSQNLTDGVTEILQKNSNALLNGNGEFHNGNI